MVAPGERPAETADEATWYWLCMQRAAGWERRISGSGEERTARK
jgi:hypothetical protein